VSHDVIVDCLAGEVRVREAGEPGDARVEEYAGILSPGTGHPDLDDLPCLVEAKALDRELDDLVVFPVKPGRFHVDGDTDASLTRDSPE
jgi:hypothetical protein